MGLAILGVVLLLYILLAYFAAKTWQVWHVVLLVFLFIFSFVFMFLAAATLKVQDRWRTQYVSAAKSLETERQNHQRLTMGSIDGQQPGQVQLRGAVKRMLIDRGRVWRNLRLAELGEGQVILDATEWDESGCGGATTSDVDGEDYADEEEAADAAPAEPAAGGTAPPLGLDADAVVYAFKEAPLATLPQPLQQLLISTTALGDVGGGDDDDEEESEPEAGEFGEASVDASACKIPTYYMGEYKVVGDPNANPATLTLAPTMPLSEGQIEHLQDQNNTWVLYEVMPVDAHEAFAGMSAEQLSQLIPAGDMDPTQYEALINSYARDLKQGDDADPPDRKWATVRFTQPVNVEVDVDVQADTEQQPLSDSLFDPSGRSLVATLSQGSTTEFSEGDEATFDFATAQELRGEGKVEVLSTVFHRRLRDYARAFRSIHADLNEMSRQIELAESDLEKVNESMTQLQSQIAFQTQQGEALSGDLQGLQTERQILDEYAALMNKKWSELRAELSRLYRSNRQLVSRLAAAR